MVDVAVQGLVHSEHKLRHTHFLFLRGTSAERAKILEGGGPKVVKVIEARVHEQLFSGEVLVVHNDKVLFEQAYGFADREAKISMTTDAKLRIASPHAMPRYGRLHGSP